MMEAQFRCPSCAALLRVRDVASTIDDAEPGLGWQSHTMHTLRFGDAAPTMAQVHERTTPTRAPGKEPDVTVPLWHAVVSTVAIGGLSVVLTIAGQWPAWVPPVVASVVFPVAWFWRLRIHTSLLSVTERILNRDIDGDGRIADRKPAEVERRVSFNAVEMSPTGRWLRSRRIDIPRGDERAIVEMARGVNAGEVWTQRKWAHIYNRIEFNELRATLIKLGYAVWRDENNHNDGADLTAPGRALFRALANPAGDLQ